MKKGFLCILLSLLMILPLLTACNKEADLSGSEVSIYTFYTIVDEATSPEAIRQVELALNRILFHRLGVILDLQMVTEDEYDEFIAEKLTELEDYNTDKANNPYAANAEDPETMTGDRVLDMLENGEDIVLNRPRVDVFLVRGYDNYYTLASEGKLAALDERLNNQANELKSQIHTTLRDAAKVGNKTYGIPINTAVGEYTYMVFDKGIVDDLNPNLSTIKTLEDLEGFLAAVQNKGDKNSDSFDADYEDVIPLYNTGIPEGINFIINNGFPALVSSTGEVISAYDNKTLKDYFTMIAKYNASGYITSDPAEDARFAVRIESGSKEEIVERLGGSEKDYEFVQFTTPIATNENTLKNLLCIPASASSDDIGATMKIINEINTDEELMNLITYGIQKTHGVEIAHYELNDKNQVERNEENLYIVDPQYIGNCFITYTLAGEDPNKWANQIAQNKIAIASPTLGFTITPVEFSYTEKVEDEEGNVTFETVTIDEPDFIGIVNNVIDKYYPNLMNGSFLNESTTFDYDAISKQLTDELTDELTAKLDEKYSNYLKMLLKNEELERLETVEHNALMSEAEQIAIDEDLSSAIDYFESSLGFESSESSIEESSEAEESDEAEESSEAEEESSTPVEEDEPQSSLVSNEYVIEHIDEYYATINTTKEARIAEEYAVLKESKAEAAVKAAVGTSKFNSRYQALKSSAEYKNELDELLKYNLPKELNKKINDEINAEVEAYTEAMVAEINKELKTAVKEFVLDYAAKRKAGEDALNGDDSDAEASDEEVSDTSSEVESSEDASADSTDGNYTAGDIFEGEAVDEYTEKIKEEVLLAIGFYEKKTVTQEDTSTDDTSSDDTSSDAESSEGDSADAESSEIDTTEAESSEVVESSEASNESANDESAAEGEGEEEKEPVEVITEAYNTWLDFVIKGKVATQYYVLHPMATA